MSYQKLDNEELLRLALDAVNQNHHAEAVSMLKTMLDREPSHVFATYLLAAEHAQLGMMDRAEQGFRRTVELAPEFPMARFQLGQMHMVKGDAAAARAMLSPLADPSNSAALGCYARGLIAATNEDLDGAIQHLRAGLACEQEIPVLADDMRRVLANLTSVGSGSSSSPGLQSLPEPLSTNPAAAPMLLSNYGRSDS